MLPQIKGIALAERDKEVLWLLQRTEATRRMSAEEYTKTSLKFTPEHPFWKHMERVAKSKWSVNSFSLITLRFLWASEEDGEAVYELYVSFTGHRHYDGAETRISDREIAAAWGPL